MECIKCGEIDKCNFYSSSLKYGDYRCKKCVNLANQRWRENHIEYFREYVRKYMHNHPELNNRCFDKWYSQHADIHYKRRLAYARANPQRHNAQSLAFAHYPDTQTCEVEECFELGERHHDDYNKPLEIRWLCRKHHKELHRKFQLVEQVV